MRTPPSPHRQATASAPAEDVDAPQQRVQTSEFFTAPIVRAGLAGLGVPALLVLITWTLLTDASHLSPDFPADAWFMAHQADALRHGTFPSLTLTSPYAAFYPVFAFYGGTLFAFGGMIALLVGSAMAAEIIVYLLVLAAAYGGGSGSPGWQVYAPGRPMCRRSCT